ncbi:MAG TPA: UDP-N-acetylglucosamine 1-carboxyvinyltransferase [Firmicutes bacterium]|nr:UDP-N-acetylglucosamine 1-carboxyvinyltransferase [Bacillota bacterium]
MDTILVRGGRRLHGKVSISGAKNAALPIMAASLLSDGEVVLSNIPDLDDVSTMCDVLEALGVRVRRAGSRLLFRADNLEENEAPYPLIRKMRASFLVAGPLLARLGAVRIPLPGGCAIGLRPIDLHLKGFMAMGAEIRQDGGVIEAVAPRGLHGARVYLDVPSVGATENILMASCFASGETIIENAAREPEVVDLANFLVRMGADIRGAGTSAIRVTGVSRLSGVAYEIIPDRIEAGTYMIACAIAGGDVFIRNAVPEHIRAIAAKLAEVGVRVIEADGGVRVIADKRPAPTDITTTAYPGFPTDLQPQMMALLSVAAGTSVITETVFEGRFMHVAELKRMGARIRTENQTAIIEGVGELSGARVRVPDLRAGAALVLAGLRAEGETEISDVHHIDRGYESIEAKLRAIGADIERVSDGVSVSRIAQVL